MVSRSLGRGRSRSIGRHGTIPFSRTYSRARPLPDQRQHRGPHPEDKQLFAAADLPVLRAATTDLSWLLTRGYAPRSAVKLVGDRYRLDARQRKAICRCACSDDARTRRQRRQVPFEALDGCELWIDGYNVLTTVEAALSGGVILHARDGCYRDLASMHGSYRRVQETVPAIDLLGQAISQMHVGACRWLLDRPVSNSGRLKTLLGQIASERGWKWHVELVADPDRALVQASQVTATADSGVLDYEIDWCNLARWVVDSFIDDAWTVDLAVNTD